MFSVLQGVKYHHTDEARRGSENWFPLVVVKSVNFRIQEQLWVRGDKEKQDKTAVMGEEGLHGYSSSCQALCS